MEYLDKLLELFEDIEQTYRKICICENEGIKNGEMFSELVNHLRKKVSEEDKLFEEFMDSDDFDLIMDTLHTCDEKSEFIERINNKFIVKSLEEKGKFNEDDIDEFGVDDIFVLNRLSILVGKINNIISENLMLMYSYFIDKTIDELVVKSLKTKLIRIKYYNCMIKTNLERAYLNYNFNYPMDVYSDLNLKIDILKLDERFVRDVVLDVYLTSINHSCDSLLSFTDDSYSSSEDYLAASINYQCLLKAVFSLMCDSEYRDIEGKIIKHLKLNANDGNIGSVEEVLDIMKNRNEYRSKVKRLSLKPLWD